MRIATRAVAGAAAAVVSLTALAGCRTNVGAAATIGGNQISSSRVASFVTRSGPTAAAIARAKQDGTTLGPRTQVLQVLVQEQVYDLALRKRGGVPAATALGALHDKATQRLLQTSLTGTAFDRAVDTEFVKGGVKASLRPHFLRLLELEEALIERTRAGSLAELAAAVTKTGIRVSVSPRYGVWNPATVSIDSASSAGLPGFLTLQGAGASKQAQPTQ